MMVVTEVVWMIAVIVVVLMMVVIVVVVVMVVMVSKGVTSPPFLNAIPPSCPTASFQISKISSPIKSPT